MGNTSQQISQNFAYSDSPPTQGTAPASEAAPYQIAPTLHRALLPDEYQLYFNHNGPASVVVLNPPAQRVLEAFAQPITLQESLSKVPELSPSEALQTARNLAALGLLTQVTSEQPAVISQQFSGFNPKSKKHNSQPAILTVWLHVTNQCNLRCPYCYIHKTPDEMEIEQGREAVAAVFRSAVQNGFSRVKLKYAGGEPTLHFKLLILLHDYAQELADEHDLALDGVVLSNGVALSHRMIEEMNARGLRLMISLDGVGDTHDAMRPFVNGHGSFAHVERTLDRLTDRDLTPTISITVSARNLAGLPETVAYVLARGLPFTLNFYRENDCSASFTDLVYQDDQIIAAMRAAFAVIEANLPKHSILASLTDRARLDIPHNHPCGVGQSYMVIDQFGKIAKCHMEMGRAIADVSHPDPLNVIRLDQLGVQNPAVVEKTGCQDCIWRYWCAGGCPALTYRTMGRWDVKSPNCRVYQTLFPEVLRLEGLRLMKWGSDIH